MSSRSRLGVEDCRCSNNKSLLVFRYPSGNQQEPLLKRVVLPPARDRQKKEKIERSASAALEVEVDGNVTVPLCVAFEVVIGFFSLLSEASEPITKLLGNFFVVEIFRRVSWFRIKSGSVSLSRFDLWLIVVDPSERRTARRCRLYTRPPPPNVWFTCKRSRTSRT